MEKRHPNGIKFFLGYLSTLHPLYPYENKTELAANSNAVILRCIKYKSAGNTA